MGAPRACGCWEAVSLQQEKESLLFHSEPLCWAAESLLGSVAEQSEDVSLLLTILTGCSLSIRIAQEAPGLHTRQPASKQERKNIPEHMAPGEGTLKDSHSERHCHPVSTVLWDMDRMLRVHQGCWGGR